MPSQALVGAAVAVVLILAVMFLRGGRRVLERRTVLLHVPADHAWEFIRNFPAVYAGHARARGVVALDRYLLKRGDGETSGSLWRTEGLWGGAPYWADVEIARSIPQRELSVRLVRDSRGTHRGLAEHLGTMTIQADGPKTTKLTWVLRARLKGVRLRASRILDPTQLQMRLLDIGLRSLKVAVEAAHAASVGAAAPSAGTPGAGAPGLVAPGQHDPRTPPERPAPPSPRRDTV